VPYYNIIPLHELIALHVSTSLNTKRVWSVYDGLISLFGNELNILLEVVKDDFLKKEVDGALVDLILLARKNKLRIDPGFDGEYGRVLMPKAQSTLF